MGLLAAFRFEYEARVSDTKTPLLSSLRGQPVPADIAEDLRLFATLPQNARERFYEILGPCLADPLPNDVDARLGRFCGSYGGIEAGRVARVIKGCRYVLRNASAIDLDAQAFAEDLRSVTEGNELGEALLGGYEEAKVQVRTEMLRGAITDHGKTVEGIDWRIDTVSAADRGERFRYAVAILTLRYQEGNKHERITLQVLPDMLQELRAICDRLLNG